MTTYCTRCSTDEDLAKISIFLLERKRDLHPSYDALDMITLLYSYITQGHILQITDEEQRVLAAAAYYHGTLEHEFRDKEVVLIDIAIFDKSIRGTQMFIKGLRFMVELILKDHPEVQELRLAALAENAYLCKLYAKLTSSSYNRKGNVGDEVVFCVDIKNLWTILGKFDKLNFSKT